MGGMKNRQDGQIQAATVASFDDRGRLYLSKEFREQANVSDEEVHVVALSNTRLALVERDT